MLRSLVVAVLCAAFFAGPVLAADPPRTLTWDHLIPEGADYPPDPLGKLTPQQQDDLGFVFRMRSAAAGAGLNVDHEMFLEAEEVAAQLREQGVDIDGMIAKLRAWEAERNRVDRMIKTDLDGARVRIPGYVLPLEYEGEKLTSFMLVPYVGACIHVPPPPANQMAYVKVQSPIPDEGLFAPVWVTGTLNARAVESKSLYITDGTMDVSYGYSLDASRVELYRE